MAFITFSSLLANASTRTAVGVIVLTGPLEHLGPIGVPSPGSLVDAGQRLEALGVLGNRVGNALGVEEVSLLVEVVDVVTLLMVVDVVGNTGLAAKELGLLLSLELLGTSEETTGGDTVLDEGGVIRSTAELRGDIGLAVGLEELFKVLLDNIRASRASEVEGVAITIVDTIDVVGAGNLVRVSIDLIKWMRVNLPYQS